MPEKPTPMDRNAWLADPSKQRGRVFIVMRDAEQWLQLHEIATEIYWQFQIIDSEAAISARLRDLRNHHDQVVMKHARRGSHAPEYRMMVTTQWYLCGCGHEFPVALGKYGCPNCEGEESAELQGLLPLEVVE